MDEDRAALGAISTLARLESTMIAPSGESSARPALHAARYRPVARLGEGGMGEVEHVYDEDLMRDLAVKCLRAHVRSDARMVTQFLWEARVTAHLDHPNIVPLHDLGIGPEGELYFTMKKVDGTPLDVALEKLAAGDPAWTKRLTLPRRLRVFAQICDAIAFAHERGVLHRDLKPGNVMLGAHGEVLVMDWGLACPLPTEAGERFASLRPEEMPDTGASGTPLYMSPEQARGEALDARSDVYTLGVILYELATLARPYEETNVLAILDQVREGRARPVREAASVSSALCAVIERAMACERGDRYPSVAELREEIEVVIEGGTPRAEDASLPVRVGRFYAGRSAALAQMRVLDFELSMTGATLLGASFGALLAGWVGGLWWIGIPAGALLLAPTTWRFLRLLRVRHRY